MNEHSIAQMFDGIAGRYDFLNRLLSLRQDVRWRKALVSRIRDRPDLSLLDVATGTGDVIASCLTSNRPAINCTGIDIAKEMLAIARQKLPATVNLHQMSARQLQFADQSFDVVTIAFGLRNITDQQLAIKEFYRVIKPQGQLLILEFFPSGQGYCSRLLAFYTREILPRIASLVSDRQAYRYLPASVASYYSREKLSELVVTNNFQLTEQLTFLRGLVGLLAFKKPSVGVN